MANTLYEYFQSSGQALPSISERGSQFAKLGLGKGEEYRGTSSQNTALLKALKGNSNALQGSKPPTGAPTSSQTTTTNPPVVTSNQANQAVNQATSDISSMSITQNKPKTVGELDTALYDTMSEAEKISKDTQDQIASLQDGAIQYSPDEQAQLNAISSAVANATRAQERANRQSERGTRLISNIRGVGEFAPVRGMSMMQQTIQSGLDQLRTIEVEGASKLAEAKQAIRSNRFDEIVKTSQELKDTLKMRQDVLGKLRDNAFEMEKFEYQQEKDARDYALASAKAAIDIKKGQLEIAALEAEASMSGGVPPKIAEKIGTNKVGQVTNAQMNLRKATQNYVDWVEANRDKWGTKEWNTGVKALQNSLQLAIAGAYDQGAISDGDRSSYNAIVRTGPDRAVLSGNQLISTISGTIDNNIQFLDQTYQGYATPFFEPQNEAYTSSTQEPDANNPWSSVIPDVTYFSQDTGYQIP